MGNCNKRPKKDLYRNQQQLQTKIKNKDEIKFTATNFLTEMNDNIEKDYILLSPEIGKGRFGKVKKSVHKQSCLKRAVKIIEKSKTTEQEQLRIINEVTILRKLDHPNIIKIFEFFQDSANFYVVTELCEGGELFRKLEKQNTFDEKETAIIMRQILSALHYCHSRNIVHRDIKPENCLFDTKEDGSILKVIDFGTSLQFSQDEKITSKFGTSYYVAPEIQKAQYDEKCDIWSAGVILYALLVGYPPFSGRTDYDVLKKVMRGKFKFHPEFWEGKSESVKSLIKQMLTYNPKKRITAIQALNHPWIRDTYKDFHDSSVIGYVLKNLKKFRFKKKLEEAAWLFITSYLVSKEEKTEITKAFLALDKNGDGILCRNELVDAFRDICDQATAEADADMIMDRIDTNKSGSIDYHEFLMGGLNKAHILSQKRLKIAFNIIDKDGSGKLELKELKSIFDSGGAVIEEDVWLQLVSEVDENGDGEISFNEFENMMWGLAGSPFHNTESTSSGKKQNEVRQQKIKTNKMLHYQKHFTRNFQILKQMTISQQSINNLFLITLQEKLQKFFKN